MLLENEGEILAMTETITGTYEGISPVIVDNDNSTISLEQSAKEALDCVVTNSATWNDASGNGGYYSKYQPYGLNAISGNLVIEGSRYPRQTFISVSSDNSASTAGIIPPVPEQNLTAERYLVAASGSLADVSWKEIPNFDSIQSNSATWNEVSSKLDTTSFSTVSGDFYPYSNPSGFITGVDLSDYYTKNETSGADELANAFSNIPAGDEEVNNTVHTYSGDWNSTYTTVHNNSASWAQGGSFTGVTTDATLTGDGLNSPLGVADTQTLSSNESISITTAVNGVILGVNSSWFDNAVNSAVTGTQGDAEVNAAVHNNSATWNTVTNKLDTTAFSTVSGTFLTAHQQISSTEWNSVYETVETNSGSWGAGGTGDMEVANLEYATLWDEQGNEFYNITGYDGSAFGLGSFYVTNSDSILKNGGDSLIEINDNGIRLDNPDGGYSEQNSFYGGDYFHIGSYRNPSAYIEGYADGSIVLFDDNHVSGSLNVSAISSWNDVHNTVESNSASWAGGGSVDTVPFIVQSPLTTGFSGTSAYIGIEGEAFHSSAFVPWSADSLPFGNNSATVSSFALGNSNSARQGAISVGRSNAAISEAISVGKGNYAFAEAIAVGTNISSRSCSIGAGMNCTAGSYSLTLGQNNKVESMSIGIGNIVKVNGKSIGIGDGYTSASNCSIALGNYCSATNYAYSLGDNLVMKDYGMTLGKYNKTSSDASFVVGNGTSTAARSDSFIIYHDGSVSACGKISANGVELGAGGGYTPTYHGIEI